LFAMRPVVCALPRNDVVQIGIPTVWLGVLSQAAPLKTNAPQAKRTSADTSRV
jgi:hypothetical protein